MEFKSYYYYSKSDPTKEAIDKIIALNQRDALLHFAERKQMDKSAFTKLYNIETNEQIQPK